MKKKVIASAVALTLAFSAALPSVCFAKSALTHFGTVIDLSELPEPTREEVLKAVAEAAKKEMEGKNIPVFAQTEEPSYEADQSGVRKISKLSDLFN